jgi:hypothetical protein
VDYGADFIAVFIAQGDDGAEQIGAFSSGGVGAMAEAAGGDEEGFAAFDGGGFGDGAADEEVLLGCRDLGACEEQEKG